MTRRVIKEAFPDDAMFIDYEALTAALPAECASAPRGILPALFAPAGGGRALPEPLVASFVCPDGELTSARCTRGARPFASPAATASTGSTGAARGMRGCGARRRRTSASRSGTSQRRTFCPTCSASWREASGEGRAAQGCGRLAGAHRCDAAAAVTHTSLVAGGAGGEEARSSF